MLLWRRLAVPREFSVLIFLNLASLAVSTAVSTRPGLSLMGTSWREFGLIPQAAALMFAWTVAGGLGSARVVLRGVAVAGIAAGAYGIAQYFGWDPLLPASAYHIGEGVWTIVRPPGTMGYVSYFATWLSDGGIPWRCAGAGRIASRVAMPRVGFYGDLHFRHAAYGNARGDAWFGRGRSCVAVHTWCEA